jgi:flagellar biosynthesis/type III secretory pathway chaperone
MTAGPITRALREYKATEEKIKRLTEKKRPLVEKLIDLERKIYGKDRRIMTAFRQQTREL